MMKAVSRGVSRSTRQNRAFWSSAGRKAGTIDIQENNPFTEYNNWLEGSYADKPQHGTVLYKYGTLNLWGLSILAAVSKEVYVLDAVGGTGWIPDLVVLSTAAYMLGPAIRSDYDEDLLKDERLKIACHEAATQLYETKIREISALEAQPAHLEQYLVEYKTALEEQAVAEIALAKRDHYNAMIDRLEVLAAKKAARAHAEGNVDAELVQEHILSSFSTDGKLQDASIDEVLAYLESGEYEPKALSGLVDAYKSSAAFQEARNARLAPEE
jgi:hypothetical protein